MLQLRSEARTLQPPQTLAPIKKAPIPNGVDALTGP
jgi:hypothetical protein